MKIVLQDGIKDCGVCSLLSVIRYYGGDVSKEYLREITNTTKNGVSAYGLIEGANKLGFIAEGMSGDLSKIENNNLPCLAHIAVNKNYKHFIVIYKIDNINKKIIVMDPAKGKRTLSFSEFNLLSTGNFIFLKVNKKIPNIKNKNYIKKTIVKFFVDNKNIILFLSFFIISCFILNVLTAFHFKYLLEFVVNYNVKTNLKVICIIIFSLYVFKVFNSLFRNILFNKISFLFDEILTEKTFKQILLLPYLYYKNRTTGEVITRLKDLFNVKNYLIKLLSVFITDFFSLLIFYFMMFKINKKLSIIVLIISSTIIIFTLGRNKKLRKLYSQVCRKEESINSYLVESLSNVDTIKGGHIEKRLSDKFNLLYKDLLEKSYLYSLFLEIGTFFNENIKDFTLIVLYYLGCLFILSKKMDLSSLFIYQTLLLYYLSSLNSLKNMIDEYHNFSVSLNRVEDLYTISNENFSESYYYYSYKLDGDIIFNNLSYKYGSKLLFDSINFKIKSGEKILLIGESGTGKSSLVKILMRYLEVPYGMCSISGIDINHYHLENVRRNISYVSSNDFLFTDSLINNITLEKEYLDEEINDVLKISMVDKIVSKRNTNLNMMVEENGFNFSSGEKQKIILSRYLLRNSSIYILDEALGQIDIKSEKIILKNMFNKYKDKIFIVISHRKNNMYLYDHVFKLRDGKLYEEKIS